MAEVEKVKKLNFDIGRNENVTSPCACSRQSKQGSDVEQGHHAVG